jgi:class 3 adenylate cyclase
MNCPKCQFENRDGVTFCENCGTALELVCSNCGATLPLDRNFCGKCGQKVFEEAKEETIQLTTEGERKHVTVLFSDLSGYTAMSERLDPEEVKEITGRIFDDVSKIVSKYDGFIEKYAGDAVMALFGANQSHEDDPIRAIKAAQKIHDLVQALSPQYEPNIGRPLSMHTGINTGLVVTGELILEKGVHGVAGDAINVAARLSSAAKTGEILVDHETFTRSEGYFQFEDLAPIHLEGKTKPVQIHKFLSAKEQPRKIHRLHGLRAELIGRKAEMTRLAEAVEDLKQGKGAVFSIIGPAGTGKSRLMEEFKTSLDLKEIQWREGNAFAYAQNIPYFPLIDLISKAIQIDEGDSPETVKEKLESSLEVLIEKNQDVAPYIGSLYALDYPEILEVSPEFWKTKMQEAVLMVLTALAQRAPTVVCLEDLHWADPSTIELVHFLLSEIRHPVLFLCVYRPIISLFSEHQINALTIRHQELHLRDLSLSEAQNMVESLLQTEAVPKDLQLFIQNKVEGNPFYLEEAINSLIESNILVPENGNWKVVRPITETEVSATIQGVIAARVDRLNRNQSGSCRKLRSSEGLFFTIS